MHIDVPIVQKQWLIAQEELALLADARTNANKSPDPGGIVCTVDATKLYGFFCHQSVLHCIYRCLYPAGEVELAQDALHVNLDGGFR